MQPKRKVRQRSRKSKLPKRSSWLSKGPIQTSSPAFPSRRFLLKGRQLTPPESTRKETLVTHTQDQHLIRRGAEGEVEEIDELGDLLEVKANNAK